MDRMKRNLLLLLLLCGIPGALFSNTIYFPQVAFGGGYSTTFVIMNTGTTAISGTLSFFSQAGVARSDLNSQVNIPVGGSVRYAVPNTGALTVVWAQFAAGAREGAGSCDLRLAKRFQSVDDHRGFARS